jgi:hypothetical protein
VPEAQRFYTGKSGTHRDDGIFLAQGPGVRAGLTVAGARIIDLAPTILRLLDVAVPADMDGRVLDEIFTGGLPAAAPAAVAPWPASAVREDGVYSAADEQKMTERLTSLGYLE